MQPQDMEIMLAVELFSHNGLKCEAYVVSVEVLRLTMTGFDTM